jgi:hypothetical protein
MITANALGEKGTLVHQRREDFNARSNHEARYVVHVRELSNGPMGAQQEEPSGSGTPATHKH